MSGLRPDRTYPQRGESPGAVLAVATLSPDP